MRLTASSPRSGRRWSFRFAKRGDDDPRGPPPDFLALRSFVWCDHVGDGGGATDDTTPDSGSPGSPGGSDKQAVVQGTAARVPEQPTPPRSPSAAYAPPRIRGPWLVLGLTLVTLGIYWFAWYFLINRELRDFGRRHGQEWLARSDPHRSLLAVTVGVVLVVPPFISLANTVRRIRRAEQVAEVKAANGWIVGAVALASVALLLVPLLFIPSYLQQGLTKPGPVIPMQSLRRALESG